MKKCRSISLVIAFLMVFALAACSGAEPVFRFSVSHIALENDPLHEGWTMLARLLEERSGGRIQATILGSRALSNSNAECADLVQQNIVQMTSVPGHTAAALGNVEPLKVFDFPFLFLSNEDVYTFMDSDLFAEYGRQLERITGVRAMKGYSLGWINIMTTNTPPHTIENLAGLRIRTMATDVQMAIVSSLGGSPISVAFGELYTAAQQGIIDGLMTTEGLMVSERFFEVCRYKIRSEIMPLAHIPLLNVEWYNSLPADLQQIFDEAFEEFVLYARRIQEAFAEEAVGVLRANGVTVIEVSPELRQQFIEATAAVYANHNDAAGPGTVEAVRAVLGR